MSAASTAMPVAADTKLCTVRPSICVRWLTALSPLYACQLVLVVKLMAVLKARSGAMPVWPSGLSGNQLCTRKSRYSAANPATLKRSMARA